MGFLFLLFQLWVHDITQGTSYEIHLRAFLHREDSLLLKHPPARTLQQEPVWKQQNNRQTNHKTCAWDGPVKGTGPHDLLLQDCHFHGSQDVGHLSGAGVLLRASSRGCPKSEDSMDKETHSLLQKRIPCDSEPRPQQASGQRMHLKPWALSPSPVPPNFQMQWGPKTLCSEGTSPVQKPFSP